MMMIDKHLDRWTTALRMARMLRIIGYGRELCELLWRHTDSLQVSWLVVDGGWSMVLGDIPVACG